MEDLMRKQSQIIFATSAAIGTLCVVVICFGGLSLFNRSLGLTQPSPFRFEVQDLPLIGIVRTLAFSPDGNFLAAGTQGTEGRHWSGTVKIWRVADGKEMFARDFLQWTKKLLFTNDGRFLAVASSSRSDFVNKHALQFVPRPAVVTILNFPEMTVAKELEFEDIVETICFSPDGSKIAVARSHHLGVAWNPKDREVREPEIEIVDWQSGASVRLDSPKIKYWFSHDLSPMEFSKDGKHLFVNAHGNGFESFEVESGKAEGMLPPDRPIIGFFLTSPMAQDVFWMGASEARRHRSADQSLVDRLHFSNPPESARSGVSSVSGDGKRLLGVSITPDRRERVIWEDINEKQTIEVFVPDVGDARVNVSRFNPANPDIFAVALLRSYASALLNPGVPRPERGPLLLFRLKKWLFASCSG